MGFFEAFVATFSIIAVFGFPCIIVWLVLKHRQKMALNRNPGAADAEVEGLSRIADILDQRVRVLETILDDEVPDWRDQIARRTADEVVR